jgi:hypothetical protein
MVAMAGCGYSAVKKNSSPFPGRSLHVALFANNSYQPDVEGFLRRALVDELAVTLSRDQAAEKSAELLLGGDIESLVIDNAAFSAKDRARLYRISLTVQARVTDRKSGKLLWQTKEVVREEYPATTDMALQRNARDAAIAGACREMARLLVIQMNRSF